MARLYWRVKVNEKWTWKPAKVISTFFYGKTILEVIPLLEEEE